jgi:hypothetical protein
MRGPDTPSHFFRRATPRNGDYVLCPECEFETVFQQVNEPACCLSCRLSLKAGIPTKRQRREERESK